MMLAAMSGCIGSPTDGSRIGTRTSSVAFNGYHNAAATVIRVEAQNPSTGAFANIASAMTGSGAAAALGTNWFPWSTSAVVPTAYWAAGRTGARALIRARTDGAGYVTLYGLEENWMDCMDPAGSVTKFRDECTTGNTATICTSDYAPFSSRRGPCPPRQLVGTGAPDPRRPLPDTTSTQYFTSVPSSIGYRGDANSFIDVFDVTPNEYGFGYLGSGNANVVRIYYPRVNSSTETVTYSPAALAASLGTQVPWGGTRIVRQYDRGECSSVMPWRDILDALVPALTETVQSMTVPGLGTISLLPQSRITLRPEIRSTGGDAVHLFGTFVLYTPLGRAGTLDLDVTVRIEPDAGSHLTAVVEPLSKVDFHMSAGGYFLQFFGIASETEVEAAAMGQVRTMVPGMITELVPGAYRLLPIFKRVYVRPDALEIVHAEDTTSIYYTPLNNAHLCTRPNPSTIEPATGLMFDLFDPPWATDPRVFGDTRRP
jgi:hypothetical protein